MDWKYMLLGIALNSILFILYLLWPRMTSICRMHKKLREKKKREKAFKEKMKELEIKWISNRLVIFKKH